MSLIAIAIEVLRGALVLAAGLAAAKLLRKSSAQVRHFVVAGALLATLVLPFAARLAPSWTIERAAAPATLPPVREPVSERAFDGVESTDVAPLPAVASSPEPHAQASTIGAIDVVLMVWAAGALLVLLRLVVRQTRASLLARRSSPLAEGDVAAVIAAAARVAGVSPRRFRVRVSKEIESPAVTGIVRPVVLVPPSAATWSAQRWRVVLLHELAHVRRNDCLTQLLAEVACALRWYDPLAWIAARRLHAEREHAADDAVLQNGARATDYAEHLLAIATAQVQRPSHAALAMAERSALATRVTALLEEGRARRPLGRAAAVSAALATSSFAFVVACATPQEGTVAPTPASAGTTHTPAASTPSSAAPTSIADAVAAHLAVPASSRVELTLDPALQAVAEEEVARVESEWKATAALAIVLDPKDGAILAIAGRKAGASSPFLAATRSGAPGSTAKIVTLAAALENGAVKDDEKIFCENGKLPIPGTGSAFHDSSPHGWLTISEVLAVSSNIGTLKVAQKMPRGTVDALARKFHFGEAPAVQIPNAATGALPREVDPATMPGWSIVNGEAWSASALQMAATYATIAEGGVYHAPTIVRRVLDGSGHATWEHRPTAERVVSEETSRRLIQMLEGVVTRPEGTGKAARIEGVRIAGKTGTADLGSDDLYYGSFVGIVPAQAPRYVILVGAESKGMGGEVAAPTFARIAKRALSR